MNLPITVSPIEKLYATSGSEKHRELNAEGKIDGRELFSKFLNGNNLSQVAYAGLAQEFNLSLSLHKESYRANPSDIRSEKDNGSIYNIVEDDHLSHNEIDGDGFEVTGDRPERDDTASTDDLSVDKDDSSIDKKVVGYPLESIDSGSLVTPIVTESQINLSTARESTIARESTVSREVNITREANNTAQPSRTPQTVQQQTSEPLQSVKVQENSPNVMTRVPNSNGNTQLRAKVIPASGELASQPSANLAASAAVTAQANQNNRLGGDVARLPASDLANNGVETNSNVLVSRPGGKPTTNGANSRQGGKPSTNAHQHGRLGSETAQLSAGNLAGGGIEPNSNELVTNKSSKANFNGRLGGEANRLTSGDLASNGTESNSNGLVSRQGGKPSANSHQHGNSSNQASNQVKLDAQGALTGGQQAAQQAAATATQRNNLFAATLARANSSISQQSAQPLSGDIGFGVPNNDQQQTQRVTDMPQPQRAKPQLPPRSISEQVSVQVQRAIGQGTDRISIQLKPAELGRIEVKLEVAHDGRLNAVISAERSDTLDLLKQDAKSLQQSLQQAGLNADSSSLSFTLQQQAKSFEQALGKDSNGQAGSEEDQGTEDDANEKASGSRNIITNDVIDVEV